MSDAPRRRKTGGKSRPLSSFDGFVDGSTTVTLENLLTHHFQRLSSQPFNPQPLLHLNREGYLLLIFDGFDETIAYSEPGLRCVAKRVLHHCSVHFRDTKRLLRHGGAGTRHSNSRTVSC